MLRLPWKIPRFSALLLVLIAFLIVTPMLPLSLLGLRLVDVSLTALLIVGTLTVERRHLVPLAWTLAVPALLCAWAVYFEPSRAILFTGLLFRSAFILLLLGIVIADILKEELVTGDTIAAASCGYFLLGVWWAGIFAMMEVVEPGSFNLPDEAADPFSQGALTTMWFLYFSFVTITTLGYGDVTPATLSAGMIASTEAVIGQLYVAILIARLVAMVSHPKGS